MGFEYVVPPTPYHPAPADQNLLGWSMDPSCSATGTGPTFGQMILMKVIPTVSGSCGTIHYSVQALGTGLSNCFVGLLAANGDRLATSADQAANWMSPNATGLRSTAMVAATPVVAGTTYYVALLGGAGAALQFSRGISSALLSAGLGAGAYRSMRLGSSLTSIPTSNTLSGASLAGEAFMVAIGP